jgi:hypothetical protein
MTLSPHIDDYTHAIIDNACESLTSLRGLPCPDDPGVRLHALASLAQQIHTTLATTVLEARRHDYDWDEIADLLGLTATTRRPQPERSA